MSNEMVSGRLGRFFRSGWGGSFLVGTVFFVCILSITESLPLVWDESDAIERSWLICKWFRNPVDSGTMVRNGRFFPAEVYDRYTAEQLENAPFLHLEGQSDEDENVPDRTDHTNAPVSRFSPDVIRRYWQNTTEVDGHPAGYSLLIAGGRSFCSVTGLDRILFEKVQCRFGHILLFSIALSAVFARVRRSFGTLTALSSLFCIVCIPRVFAHGQIAACDSPHMSSWLLVWAAFETGLQSRWKAVLWGVLLGIALSMKFTSWFIPFAFIGFACCYRHFGPLSAKEENLSRRMLRLFLIGFPVSLLVFYILNPTLWHAPISGLGKFFYMCTIQTRRICPVSVSFLGQKMVNLPWYNTWFLLGITVPVGILFFGLVTIFRELSGLVVAKRNKTKTVQVSEESPAAVPKNDISEQQMDKLLESGCLLSRPYFIMLVFVNFATLMLVRMLPNAPGHDGVRLFVAAFPFFGILAGIGLGDALSGRFSRKNNWQFPCVLWKLAALLVIPFAAFNMYWYSPHWLSYYNFAIGGPNGATARGMETTYYWDGMTPDVVNWLNEHTAPDKYIWFHQAPEFYDYRFLPWHFEQRPCLPRHIISYASQHIAEKIKAGQIQWVVIQSRQGMLDMFLSYAFKNVTPAYEKCIRKGGIGPWNMEHAPLIRVYDANSLHIQYILD